ATEAELRLLLESVDEGSPFTRRLASFRLRRVHVGTGAALVIAALVAVGRWFAPGWTALAFAAVLAAVLLVGTRAAGRGISLRSGSTSISISAERVARPTGEVRP